ncbi:unnamed protein product [Pleuronectes platessa]|uniref:Uncharacterized protein n=1 Tax=Pleuronectes platessa TaxID=8262 RepID=A0A9N7VYQ8_PLEPL|nr:unnamed protein product [Pleuronectes platessa]
MMMMMRMKNIHAGFEERLCEEICWDSRLYKPSLKEKKETQIAATLGHDAMECGIWYTCLEHQADADLRLRNAETVTRNSTGGVMTVVAQGAHKLEPVSTEGAEDNMAQHKLE